MIDGLPSNSHYIAAIADDDELADRAVDDDVKPRPPRLTEWSPEVQALATTVDRLGDLLSVLIAANGGSPPGLPRYPRPVTAIERAKVRRRMEGHKRIVAQVLPHRN